MLKLCVVIEEKTPERLQTRLEYIAYLVAKGFLAGEGWDVEGEAEQLNEDDED